MPSFTAQTKIPNDAVNLIAFLESYAQEFGTVERILFAAMLRVEDIPALEKKYKQNGAILRSSGEDTVS